ncbi:MAG: ABC transporter permease subunit, partial [Pseudomonadota bacterium]
MAVSDVSKDRPRTNANLLNDPTVRSIIYQILAIGGTALFIWYLASNTIENLERQQIASGFGFLDREAGYELSESPIEYSAQDTYGRAFMVGLLNTFKVAFIGIILATVLGTIIGIARLSTNWLVAKLAAVYVETLRNIPLLLQLFLWYAFITESLPGPRQAINPGAGVFLSNRGFKFPVPEAHPAFTFAF